jgi:hypothetical protein
MLKRALIAIVVLFVAWSAMDYLIHGLILRPTYDATADLWRPMDDMNMPLMYLITLIYVACFVAIYGSLVSKKSLGSGIKFGVLFGLAAGVSMGFGSYSYMPIPVSLAWGWLLGALAQSIVAGALVGAIMKESI